MTKFTDWDIRVCLPDRNRSWIGKAFHANEDVDEHVYRPSTGKVIDHADRQDTDWVLVTTTPAGCTNIGLFHAFDHENEKFDVVISGPSMLIQLLMTLHQNLLLECE